MVNVFFSWGCIKRLKNKGGLQLQHGRWVRTVHFVEEDEIINKIQHQKRPKMIPKTCFLTAQCLIFILPLWIQISIPVARQHPALHVLAGLNVSLSDLTRYKPGVLAKEWRNVGCVHTESPRAWTHHLKQVEQPAEWETSWLHVMTQESARTACRGRYLPPTVKTFSNSSVVLKKNVLWHEICLTASF